MCLFDVFVVEVVVGVGIVGGLPGHFPWLS